jgi:hypothetical protein
MKKDAMTISRMRAATAPSASERHRSLQMSYAGRLTPGSRRAGPKDKESTG